jgi:DNA-binding MarR family transcriptional regulator
MLPPTKDNGNDRLQPLRSTRRHIFTVSVGKIYVNMTDVTSKSDAGTSTPETAYLDLPLSADDRPEIALIELLFFAYRDFISDPDSLLATYGFGRAHHRVLHFVNRHPGIRVADLLDILKITKQSLGRVLKQLIDTGFLIQLPGPLDRRQRLLYPTQTGRALALRLLEPQIHRVQNAIASLPATKRDAARSFLEGMIDDPARAGINRLIGR